MRQSGAGTHQQITIVGGGLAGLIAAISCAEQSAHVVLHEAHARLGGRGRSDDGPYKTNFGPHVLYKDGPLWKWLAERELLPPYKRTPLAGVKVRHEGEIKRTPPLRALPAVMRLRGREAPAEMDFRTWAAEHTDERIAALLSAAAGVYTFHHDPGELSAEFVWSRTSRLLSLSPAAQYVISGWTPLIDRLEARARQLGASIETGSRIEELPGGTVIVATELEQARALLGEEDSLRWPSGHTVCLDLGLRRRRGDPFVVSDMDDAGWIERFTAADPTLAPGGEELIQAQMPVRPGESADGAAARLEHLLDGTFPEWRARVSWRRRQVMLARTGALDMPGSTWRDRPAIDRGDGVYLIGDTVAAPGLLSEVSWASAIAASAAAVRGLAARPVLREVA